MSRRSLFRTLLVKGFRLYVYHFSMLGFGGPDFAKGGSDPTLVLDPGTLVSSMPGIYENLTKKGVIAVFCGFCFYMAWDIWPSVVLVQLTFCSDCCRGFPMNPVWMKWVMMRGLVNLRVIAIIWMESQMAIEFYLHLLFVLYPDTSLSHRLFGSWCVDGCLSNTRMKFQAREGRRWLLRCWQNWGVSGWCWGWGQLGCFGLDWVPDFCHHVSIGIDYDRSWKVFLSDNFSSHVCFWCIGLAVHVVPRYVIVLFLTHGLACFRRHWRPVGSVPVLQSHKFCQKADIVVQVVQIDSL